MSTDNNEPDIENLKYAENLALKVLDQQIHSVDSLNYGASVLVGLISILIGVVIAIGIPEDYNYTSLLFCISIGGFASSLILVLISAKSSDFKYIYHPRALWNHTGDDELTFRKHVYSNITYSYEENKRLLNQKWNYLRNSLYLLICSIIVLIFYVYIRIGG